VRGALHPKVWPVEHLLPKGDLLARRVHPGGGATRVLSWKRKWKWMMIIGGKNGLWQVMVMVKRKDLNKLGKEESTQRRT
jgi:hypothetical protein